MGGNSYFQFKQFKIIQERSAMKVGTDGVLLGAWVNLNKVTSILDVGAGTGLISLMLAQRCNAKITGLEIEENAAAEAEENVQYSTWSNRISIRNISFQEYSGTTTDTFDLVISNPPFFADAVKSSNKSKSIARHNDQLPFYKLVQGAEKILNPNGKLAVVLPFSETNGFIKTAYHYHLHLWRIMEIIPLQNREPNRALIEFGRSEVVPIKENLLIRSGHGNDYSEEYKSLTRDFYLNF